MVHLIEDGPQEKTKKRYTFKVPNLTGRFGIAFSLGRREVFIGVAVAEVEVEKVIKQRRLKIFKTGQVTYIPT